MIFQLFLYLKKIKYYLYMIFVSIRLAFTCIKYSINCAILLF